MDKFQNVPESTGDFLHSQKCNFPEESIIMSSFFNRTVYHFRAGSHNCSNWPDILFYRLVVFIQKEKLMRVIIFFTIFGMHTVKKGSRVSRLQAGCH